MFRFLSCWSYEMNIWTVFFGVCDLFYFIFLVKLTGWTEEPWILHLGRLEEPSVGIRRGGGRFRCEPQGELSCAWFSPHRFVAETETVRLLARSESSAVPPRDGADGEPRPHKGEMFRPCLAIVAGRYLWLKLGFLFLILAPLWLRQEDVTYKAFFRDTQGYTCFLAGLPWIDSPASKP